MRSKSTRSSATTLLLLLLTAVVQAQQCYFPDGTLAGSFAVCGTNVQNCCYNAGPSWRDACFSNGLCYSWQNGFTYRGACTDKGWGSGCVQACKDMRKDDIQPVANCGGLSDPSLSSPFACCGTPPQAAECCSSGASGGGFLWQNASIVNYELTPTTYTASSMPVTSSTQPTSPTSADAAPTASASPTSPPNSGDDDQGGDPLERTGNQIALGLGLGIGLPTLFVTFWGVYKQRSRISPVMFLRSPSLRRPAAARGAQRSSDRVPLQAQGSGQGARQLGAG